MFDQYDDSDDLVPLGEALETLEQERARFEWEAECDRAADDLGRAMGRTEMDRAPIPFISARTLLTSDYGATPWLVKGLVTKNAVAVMGGEPKTAKTWGAIELAIAVTSGTPAFGTFDCHADEPLGAVCFLVEDGEKSLQNRVRGLVAARNMRAMEWADRFFVRALGSMDLTNIAQVARYVATVRRLPIRPGIVVFDPLRDLHSVNEDSSSEMQPVYSMLRAIRSVLDCTVLFVHHASKSTDGTANRRGGQKLRGSSALHGAVDVGLYMSNSRNTRDDAAKMTTMSASVESEVKAAASAGHFSLDLRIHDNANNEAIRAEWVYTKPGDDADQAKQAEARQAAVSKNAQLAWAIFAAEQKRAPSGHTPLTTSAVAARLTMRRADLLAALQSLVEDGRVLTVAGPRNSVLYQAAPPSTAEPDPTARLFRLPAPATRPQQEPDDDPDDDMPF